MGCSKNYIMYWGGLRFVVYHPAQIKCAQSSQNIKIFIVHFAQLKII